MNDKLVRWIVSQLEDNGWSQRELARRAGLSQTTVSQVISGERLPTAEFCLQIAPVLGVPGDYVLRLAGHLPDVSEDQRRQFREISEMLASLPDGPYREQAMTAVRAIVKDARERYLLSFQEHEKAVS